MTAELDPVRLRELAAAATPGPWGWFGNAAAREVYLATRHSGRQFVMQFATWPFQPAGESPTVGDVALEHALAQPRFRSEPGEAGHMIEAADRLRYEVLGDRTIEQNNARGPVQAAALYREDISGIDFPDADYIAALSPDVVLTLLDLLDANAAELARSERERAHAADWLRVALSILDAPRAAVILPAEREPCPRCGSTGDDCHQGGGDCEEDADPADQLRALYSEVDCRIEHGATSSGHLEYVRDRLAVILGTDEPASVTITRDPNPTPTGQHAFTTLNIHPMTTAEHARHEHARPDTDRQPVTPWPRLRAATVCEDCLTPTRSRRECATPGCALQVHGPGLMTQGPAGG